jgi:hypothetical protein
MPHGPREAGRIPNAVHEGGPWRIREIVPDFTLEDVWALPAHGGAGEFSEFLEVATSLDPASSDSRASRILWELRDRLGRWFDLGRIKASAAEDGERKRSALPIPGTTETSLAGRLPEDLRGTLDDQDFGSLPFKPLFRTATEAAAELSNQTVHGVVHFAWADQGEGHFGAQMAVYVKPRGRFGGAYMTLIKPFRYLVVYPALLRQVNRAWDRRVPQKR